MTTELEKAVHKATDSKHTAPKRKHVRTIIIECWNENSARSFFTEVSKRSLDTNEVVCFKALTTTHKVIQEGPRQALVDSYYRLQWIDAIRDHWNRQVDKGYAHLNFEYATFLRDKIMFHHKHTEFEGDISLEKFLKHHKPDSFEMEKCIEIVSQLLDLQESVFRMEGAVIRMRDMNDCRAGALIPLVLESYAIYTMVTHFLTKMVDRVDSIDLLQFLIERFYSQYMTLREFYINAAAIRSVSSVIAVPSLPPDPPRFMIKKKQDLKPRARKGNTPTLPRREVPKAEPQIQNLPQHREPHLLIDPFQAQNHAPQQLQAPMPTWATFAPSPVTVHAPTTTIHNVPTTTTLTQLNTTFVPIAQPPVQQPVVHPNPAASSAWVTFGSQEAPKSSDPFSNLLSMAKSEPKPEKPKVVEEPVIAITAPSPTPMQATTTPGAAAQQAGTEKTRVVTKIITKTVTNTAELNKLKARIEELEKELDQEKELTKNLRIQLSSQTSEKDSGNKLFEATKQQWETAKVEWEASKQQWEATRTQLEVGQQQAREAYEQAEKQSAQLREELEAVLDAQHEERWNRAVEQISAFKDAIEMSLVELESPTNLGNQEATAAMVVEQAGVVSSVATRLVSVCEANADDDMFDQKNLFSAVSAVSGALRGLFMDAKGASRLVEDPNIQQTLLEKARQVGLQAAGLLEVVRTQGGQPEDDNDKKALRENLQWVLTSVDGVLEASKALDLAHQKQLQGAVTAAAELDQSGLDLDDLAERELRAAAKIIEDAAKALMAAKAAKPPKEASDTRPDVAEAILEAAMAIATATSTLVSAATSAQRERAEKGRAIAATGVPYRRDPTWAEGLISAAKAVAQATAALVGVANSAVQVEGEGEEGLIAVSKAVAAATSQLVAAARAKSDAQSPTQEKLSVAARSVSHATSLLVAAARAASTKDEKEVDEDYSKLSATGYKVKEMEQTMQILRLEKELEKARKGLLTMRKSEYAK